MGDGQEMAEMGQRLKNVEDANTMPTGHRHKGNPLLSHYRHFHMRGVSKLTIN